MMFDVSFHSFRKDFSPFCIHLLLLNELHSRENAFIQIISFHRVNHMGDAIFGQFLA